MPETDKSKRYEAICFKRSLFGRSFDYYSSAELYLFGHNTSRTIFREKRVERREQGKRDQGKRDQGIGNRDWVSPTEASFVIR